MRTPRLRRLAAGALLLGALATPPGCSASFDTARALPPRGSLGRELYALVCDRVGAQALREDVTGRSFHDVCHPRADGTYDARVDAALLPELGEGARDEAGAAVPLETQRRGRARRIARIEALARRREDLVAALDQVFPRRDVPVRWTGGDGCGASGPRDLQGEIAGVLSRLVPLYEDRTVPKLTEALGHLMNEVRADVDAQTALARVDARQGYRPSQVSLGVVRPVLTYPRLPELADVALRALHGASGKRDTDALLRVLHEELRTSVVEPPPAVLAIRDDGAGNALLSRPRTTLELAKTLLLDESPAYGGALEARFIVARDLRGLARVPFVAGRLPAGFVDGDADGLPDLDPLGQFARAPGATPAATPFFVFGAPDGARDGDGRALGAGGPLYAYLDTGRTLAAALTRDVRTLVEPDPARKKETLLDLLATAPVLLGPRDVLPSASREYEPPTRTSEPSRLTYRAFHPEASALVDLVHALGTVLADPAVDDALALSAKLLRDEPALMARLVGLALELKAIADRHPEAKLPARSTLWDELLDTFAKVAREPSILEDMLRAFADDRTRKLDRVLVAYLENKDVLSYQRDPQDPANEAKLNGAPLNRTLGRVVDPLASMFTPVDRARPDSGANRSAMQRFMQLLHDANGLAACTKEGAVAHIKVRWPPNSPISVPVSIDYPTSTLARAACVFLGAEVPPSPMPQCGILRFENVAAMLLDVALGRAKFDIRDDCLDKLVHNDTLTGLVGGANAFLEETSGIKGFSLAPTVPGVARMVFFQTDKEYYPKTRDFLKDLLDPVPSTVCPLAPFRDRDGKLLNLRKCGTFDDTLRGRDDDALFPIETLGFIDAVRPLAAAFADHGKPLYFVDLFDTLHLHWGSAAQTKAECDPKAPRTDARWCAQDGVVSYEPLLGEMMRTQLFPALADLVKTLKSTSVAHCDERDLETGACKKTTPRDGVAVFAEAVRALVDPARSAGLTDRKGNAFAVRNDGAKNAQTTPVYLLADALAGIDRAFAERSDPATLARWRKVRSDLVDAFLAVKGGRFSNRAVERALPMLIDALRAQVLARCRGKAPCVWAKDGLARSLEATIAGPTLPAVLDVIEGVRRDPGAREQLERLAVHLLDEAEPTTVAALTDLLQVMSDDVNMTPLWRVVAGGVRQGGVADTGLEVLTRVFARQWNERGEEQCGKELDPNRVLAVALGNLVTPMPARGGETPLEVVMGVIGDVNRADPAEAGAKLTGTDYAAIANEVSSFCLDETRGLEQIYEVLRQATRAGR